LNTLAQVRELGGRLERVVAQYDRLVHGFVGNEAVPLDLDSRLHLLNRELGDVTRRLQEMLVDEYEARRPQKTGSIRQAGRRSREPSQVPAFSGVGRPSVVRPFVSAACRQRTPPASDSSRIAASQ
jgi:hypothetical protein